MIPRADIIAWRASAPWISDAQVEQDLLISRSLIALFSNCLIAENLALRGGTALYKLFLHPPARYSEDIDLVQIKAGAIGEVLDAIHVSLDGVLNKPSRKQKQRSVILTYRVNSEIPPITPLRLKIEINTREHFSVLGIQRQAYAVDSRWFSGKCNITTYQFDELLGTKFRALYQRRKGRDLFDLWLALTTAEVNPETIIQSFQQYMAQMGLSVSQNEFRKNLELKMKNLSFLGDINSLLRPDVVYDPQVAYQLVDSSLINLL